VHGHGYFVNENEEVFRRFRSDSFDLRRYAFGGTVLMQQATFFRRNAFIEAGGFNPANRTCWDAELWVDFGLRGKTFRRIDEYLALFRIHSQSITGSGRLNALYERDQIRLFEKIMRRPPARFDTALVAMTRLEKWARDPMSSLIRLLDMFPVNRKQAIR
jgi:hypothetical protein